jgi:predicted ATP-binding protein involved in virulence
MDPRVDRIKGWILAVDHEASKGEREYRYLLDAFTKVVQQMTPGMKVEFKINAKAKQVDVETDSGAVSLELLSQGTQSIIGWAGIMLQRIFEIQGKDSGFEKANAVVFMDEVDAHLHPGWQQTLMGELRELFPNVQFIATTHSPLIVSSLEPQQVVSLDRVVDTGKVRARRATEDPREMGADELLVSPIFGLRSTLAQSTTHKIQQYSELLGKGPKRDAKEEREFKGLEKELDEKLSFGKTPVERKVEDALQKAVVPSGSKLDPALEMEIKRKLQSLLRKPEEEK